MKVTLEDCIDEIYALVTILAELSSLGEIFGKFGKKMFLRNFRCQSCRVIIKEVRESSET